MSKQPEALRITDRCLRLAELKGMGQLGDAFKEAAAELRRLHEANAELLLSLKQIATAAESTWCNTSWIANHANAAIAKHGGQ